METNPIREMLDMLAKENGAIVSSAACSTMEIAFARKEGRMFVDSNGYGYIVRLREWRERAEQALSSPPDEPEHQPPMFDRT